MKTALCVGLMVAISFAICWLSDLTIKAPTAAKMAAPKLAQNSHVGTLLDDLSDGTIGGSLQQLEQIERGLSVRFPKASANESCAELFSLNGDKGGNKHWLGNASGEVTLPKDGEVHLVLSGNECSAFNLLRAIRKTGIHIVEIPAECNSERVILAAARVPGVHGIKLYGGTLHLSTIQKLGHRNQLKSLVLMNTSVDDAAMVQVTKLRSLRQLKCIGMDLPGSMINELHALKQLEDLDFADCKLPSKAIQTLVAIGTLRNLNLANTGITDEDCKILSCARGLTGLGLDHNDVTDAGLNTLSKLQALQSLELKSTRVTDSSCATLASFPRLSRLDLAYTSVSDGGAAKLARTNIRDLSLEGSNVTDAAARCFHRSPALNRLVLDETSVSDIEIATLQKIHPRAQIQ